MKRSHGFFSLSPGGREDSMNRIVVIGATGSGKSTLAALLAERRGLKLVELDDLHWLPGWVVNDDFVRLADAATAGDGWVVTGNYSRLRDVIWPRADTVVWLDYPFPLVFRRLLSRSLARIIDRKVICNGNTESWRKFFSKDSIMVWLFTSFPRHRKNFGEIFDNPALHPHITFLRLRSPGDTQRWLESIQ